MQFFVHNVEIGEIKGEIKVELYPWQERMAKAKEIVYEMKDGQLVERHDFDRGQKTIEATISRIREVSVKFGDKEVKTVEDLMFYREGVSIINQISPTLLNGVSLEKN